MDAFNTACEPSPDQWDFAVAVVTDSLLQDESGSQLQDESGASLQDQHND